MLLNRIIYLTQLQAFGLMGMPSLMMAVASSSEEDVIDLNTCLHMGWSEYLTCEWQFPNASSEDETQSHR